MIKKLEDAWISQYLHPEVVNKINEIIDYLSDPEQIVKSYNDLLDRQHEGEASKGECKHGDTSIDKCEDCGLKRFPPQQEESRGECKHCHMSLSIRNPSGYCDHLQYPSYCDHCNITADIFSKPQLKEESPKEDEELRKVWDEAYKQDPHYCFRAMEAHIKANFVSKEKILSSMVGGHGGGGIKGNGHEDCFACIKDKVLAALLED